ncbi:hypothetical protein [Agriterribacter sp.]|uniref:toxin-antitoxin system YwqK family antitoxin n=1 Tax=Agriterribacter sp. TaxID=2821509 RepID=UPI002CB4C87A|nr:hypothetical protein [Agriterribacter sp.]HTN05788.1 hypothetical protein [Agriterribacter sp.]
MRYIIILLLFSSLQSRAQLKNFIISVKGDTLNRIDNNNKKQGPWVVHVDALRGEQGYEEEGYFADDKKEGAWRKYNLVGDLTAIENYKWGEKDGKQQYYTKMGDILREESWRATNPENPYDTVQVPDPAIPDKWETKVVKLEVATVAHGAWKFYDPNTGFITKEEHYFFGQKEKGTGNTVATAASEKTAEKPKAVTEWEKKNSGKKKVKVRDGSTGY